MATLIKRSKRIHASPTARLEARVSRALKTTLERAAAVSGHPTLTSFMIHSLQTSARRAIDDFQHATLTTEESTAFVQALLAPAAPNEALRAAFGRYRGEIRGGS